MEKYKDKFDTDLYKKIGFKKSFFVVPILLIVQTITSIWSSVSSNTKIESFKNDLSKNLETYKSDLETLKNKNIELFIYKKNIYTDVIRVVDKQFDSMVFDGSKPLSEGPTTQEMNEVYRQLLLVTDNEEIPVMFMKFMNVQSRNFCCAAKRAEFIKLIRNDLGKTDLKIKTDSIPYYRIHR